MSRINKNERQNQAVLRVIERRVKTFSRVEKSFYGAIVLTAITLAISVIYLQSRNLQLQQEITSLNSQISDQQTEVNNAKQEINELSRYDRIAQIANQAGLSVQNDNIQKGE